MARILVFDTLPGITDSAGRACNFNWLDATAVAGASRSKPVRIFNAKEDISVVGWEFLAFNLPSTSSVLALRWFQEFYCDKAKVAYQQATGIPVVWPRDWVDVNPLLPWMRETLAISGGAGVVNMYPVTRQMSMQLTSPVDIGASYYAPLSVHGLWARVAVWCSLGDCTGITALDQFRLKVFAHVGGHDEREYLEEHGDHPYVYNAFI